MPETFFVGIPEAKELRKELLLSVKSLLETIKAEDEFRQLREQKQATAAEFKSVLDELAKASKRLKSKFPRLAGRKPVLPSYKPEPVKPQEEEKPSPKPRKSKLELLEEELAEVEQRLKELQ
ncbi:MAG: hypothetical protein QXU88_02330 [Candidatus Woesearchaeota archaeon]